VATAIHDLYEVPVTDEFSSPEVVTGEDSHRIIVESQVGQFADFDTDRRLQAGPRPSDASQEVEAFDIPSGITKALVSGERRSSLSKVADRLREPRYWPTTLLIIGSIMAVGAIALVMMYRAALGMSWRPDEILTGPAAHDVAAPSPEEELGQAALQVITEPSGALVTVDGETVEERTPLTVDNLSVGIPHRIVVELAGYARESKEISIPEVGLQTLSLILRPLMEQPESAMVDVTTAPPGATVIIDASETPHTTPARIEVEPGVEIAISARLKGYSGSTVAITPAAGAHEKVTVALAKMPPTTGLLDLDSEPRGDVYIAGRRIGPAPVRRIKLPAGPVMVQVRNKKLGLSKTLRLDVPAGGHLSRRVVFRKGQVVFNVAPWADVYLGKKKLGTTPMPPISLYEGTYAITLVNKELGVERVIHVPVKSGKLKKVLERLQ
jgi:hypothetical protein